MNISKIREHYVDLIEHMQQNKYSKAYIRVLKTELNWLIKNYDQFQFKTYEDAYKLRDVYGKINLNKTAKEIKK